jgi:hypothetical protein
MHCKQYIFIISGAIFISSLTGCRQLLEGASDPGFITTDLEPVEKIVVSSPVRGDIYEPGESVQINWVTAFSSFSNIDIYLYRKSNLQRTIIENTQNNGSYFWRIPDVIDNSVQYIIKVVNSDNQEVFNYSGRFGIVKNN